MPSTKDSMMSIFFPQGVHSIRETDIQQIIATAM